MMFDNLLAAFQLPPEAEGIFKNMTGLLNQGGSLGQLFGLSQPEMDGTYALAAKMLGAGQTYEARGIFTLLAVLDNREARYWRGMAICAQYDEDWDAALPLYSVALAVDPDDVISYVFRAETYVEKNQLILAMNDVERAIQKGSTQPKMYAYVKRAERLKMRIGQMED